MTDITSETIIDSEKLVTLLTTMATIVKVLHESDLCDDWDEDEIWMLADDITQAIKPECFE